MPERKLNKIIITLDEDLDFEDYTLIGFVEPLTEDDKDKITEVMDMVTEAIIAEDDEEETEEET
jgi:hypothetical protein